VLRAAVLLVALAACGEGVDEGLDGEPTDAASGASCSDLFGDAPVYMPCGETAQTCSFYTRGGVRTCDAICGDLGAGCVSSFVAVDSCDPDSGDQGCGVPNAAQICECKR
jgi:hypothetical protein